MDYSRGLKPCPEAGDYFKLIFAMFLPVIGPIWGLIKGVRRAFGKKIVYNVQTTKYIHKPDARYKTGYRVIGSKKVNEKIYQLKSEAPKEDVKRFHIHAYIYILIALLGAVLQASVYNQSKIDKEVEKAELYTLTKWNNVIVSDDSSQITDEYEMIYPLVDSTVCTEFIIMRKGGNYYLLSKWSSDIDHQYSEGTATAVITTTSGTKMVKLTETNNDMHSGVFLTPQNKKVDFGSVLLFPKGVFPYKGMMLIKAREKVYTFDFD